MSIWCESVSIQVDDSSQMMKLPGSLWLLVLEPMGQWEKPPENVDAKATTNLKWGYDG